MRKAKRFLTGALAVLIVFFTGCAQEPADDREPVNRENVVNFKAVIMGTPPENGMKELYEELDALTVPELACTLRFEFIPWGNERKQINIATASGEYDFITGGVFSDYRTLVSKNAFLNLNEYLHLVPDLVRHYTTYSETALKDCEINGGLYGLPQFGMGSIKDVNEGFFYREDLRKEWGLEKITDLESMEAYLYRAKQEERYRDEPLITDNRIWQSLWLMITGGKYLEVNSMLETPFVTVRADDPYTVLNRLETPEFKQVLYYVNKWRKDGILESDLLAMSDNEGERGKNLLLADRKPCETNVPDWAAGASLIPDLTLAHPDWEYGFFSYLSGNKEWYIGSLADASVVSVSSKTREPEKAIRLLEKIHTDQRYYDLVRYGVEGIHYAMQGENITFDGIPTSQRFGWTVCSDELLNYDAVPSNRQWYEEAEVPLAEWKEEVAKLAGPYPLDGFNVITSDLAREIEKMEKAKQQYFQPLVCGYSENLDQGIEEADAAMKEAGLVTYIEKMQEQLDIWAGKR